MAYTRLFSPLRGVRDWGHDFWIHRVDKFGRRSEARGGTMSGGQKREVQGAGRLCQAGIVETLRGEGVLCRQ